MRMKGLPQTLTYRPRPVRVGAQVQAAILRCRSEHVLR